MPLLERLGSGGWGTPWTPKPLGRIFQCRSQGEGPSGPDAMPWTEPEDIPVFWWNYPRKLLRSVLVVAWAHVGINSLKAHLCLQGFCKAISQRISETSHHLDRVRWDCLESSVEGLGRVHTHFVGTYALNSPSTWGSKYLPADSLLTPILLLFLFSRWSCLTLCDPVDCSPPGFSVHGTSQARILEWVAMPSSRESSPPRDQIHFLHWQVESLPWSHREKPILNI